MFCQLALPAQLNTLSLSSHTPSRDVFLFNGTSVFRPFISWDFHLAKLITLSNQVDYHIPRLKINKLINKKLVARSCGDGSNPTQPLLQVRPTAAQRTAVSGPGPLGGSGTMC